MLSKNLAAAGAEFAHEPRIELIDEPADGSIKLGEREEALVAQARQYPALDDQNRDLDLGLVAWPARPRRHDGRAVRGSKVLVGPVDARLISVGRRDPSFKVVANDCLRLPAEEGKRIDVRRDPIR